jgi:ketosteroid isomerase-like protein
MHTSEIRQMVLERAAAVAAKDAKAMVAHNATTMVEYNLAPPLRQPHAGRVGRWQVVHEHESVPFEMDGSFQASLGLQP